MPRNPSQALNLGLAHETGFDFSSFRISTQSVTADLASDDNDGPQGSDILSGSDGSDVFYMGIGRDVVTDWKEGDRIAVTVDGGEKGEATLVKIDQVGDDTALTLSVRGEVWTLILADSAATSTNDFLS
jgi:hypothetical protein